MSHSVEDTISALLPVHRGARVQHLRSAVISVLRQERTPNELVIVEDGPLTSEHLDVLYELGDAGPLQVVRVRLPRNSGPGVANQAGLEAASGRWIAKVDADDLCLPERFSRQLDHLVATGADVCGTAMLEFEHDPAQPTSVRRPPADHHRIVQLMRMNNPISHPTAMYRRELALLSGGYPSLRFAEDYILMARLWRVGAVFTNLQDPLVHFRANADMHARRGLSRQVRLEWRLQQELRACGLVRQTRTWVNFGVRLGYRSLPTTLRRLAHRRVLGSPEPARRAR